ncbi:hypothetical protein Val02_62360 [Virgisporangium aliadipatigenens]|uniref:ABC transporter permease n=1 Tax=Virgisporangium aliadipatigenens TaxID=741659 RepID=A0A8J3YSX4_9ACTN|nr:hypothetical protein Val02_62360 [Virgisporangium aliadipatigenens]
MQTFVIGLVVLMSTMTVVIGLTLLEASSAPFDRAFAQQRGPHAIAVYDASAVTGAQLAAAKTGVAASAGPFGTATLEWTAGGEPRRADGPMTIVGRADPNGPVDRLNLWRGRWASAPGEIVLASQDHSGDGFPVVDSITLSGVAYRVVGWAYSLSGTADGWVTPAQMETLRPTSVQMLYRFAGDVSTRAAVQARLDAVTAGLPANALSAAEPYLVAKEQIAADIGVFLPFLATFGVLALIVAVVIVGNVVSGAVVSGLRQIGILKSLGFTPRQVVTVYLVMVSVPAVVGAVLGTVAGSLGAQPLLEEGFEGLGLEAGIRVSLWTWGVGLLGVPALVALAAFVPAVRAHRLSAAEAISAGSAPRRGRGTRAQRWLAGLRLPRSVSLGLGVPLSRPGRTAFTVVAVLLGVTTVTFASGLADSLERIATVQEKASGQVLVIPSDGKSRIAGPRDVPPTGEPAKTTRTDAEVEQLLRGLPDAARVSAVRGTTVPAVGQTEPVRVLYFRGDFASMGYRDELTAGRWMSGPDETVVPSELMKERRLAVGDTITLELGGRRAALTIVGEVMDGPSGQPGIFADWSVFTSLEPDRVVAPHEMEYQVQLKPTGNVAAYADAVRAADPGLDALDMSERRSDFQYIVVGFSSTLSLLLAAVAALGVFNTVVLNVRERRRDLGMLKSIGMTPRQVVAMVLTSMAAVGVVGGLLGIPVGVLAHGYIMPAAADAAQVSIPQSVMDVWQAPMLLALAFAGVVIAMLGALLPARGAARLRIAEVLHNE